MSEVKKRGGARIGAGRKKGIGLSSTIQKECSVLIRSLLKDDLFKAKAIKQLSDEKTDVNEKDYFYIIKSNNKYKFGYSSNFKKRFKSYETHNIDLTIITVVHNYNCFDLETEMIDKYKNNRIDNTEWFNLTTLELHNVLDYLNKRNFLN